MQIKNNKNSLGQLQNKGLIGDEFMAMFLEAEKELEAEIREVVEEANSYKQGWGQFILAHANDMVQHDKYKKTFEGIEKAKADYCKRHSAFCSSARLYRPRSASLLYLPLHC